MRTTVPTSMCVLCWVLHVYAHPTRVLLYVWVSEVSFVYEIHREKVHGYDAYAGQKTRKLEASPSSSSVTAAN